MPHILRNHYVLAVPDAVATAKFFIEVLGFEDDDVDEGGWRFVKKDDLLVMLGSCPDAIDPHELGDHSYFGYLVVDDIDAYFAQVSARQAEIIKEPIDEPWGMREFGLSTPDGHRLMIGQPIETSPNS